MYITNIDIVGSKFKIFCKIGINTYSVDDDIKITRTSGINNLSAGLKYISNKRFSKCVTVLEKCKNAVRGHHLKDLNRFIRYMSMANDTLVSDYCVLYTLHMSHNENGTTFIKELFLIFFRDYRSSNTVGYKIEEHSIVEYAIVAVHYRMLNRYNELNKRVT